MPGKLILMGEHAVVYHRPGIVAAVDLRLGVTIAGGGGDDVRIVLPQIGVATAESWAGLLEYARSARRRWERYAADPSAAAFRELRGDDPAHVVKVALGEAARWCGDTAPGGGSVSVVSGIPIGSGFGSSAATGVGVVAAYLAHRGHPLDRETIGSIALEVERRQHGLPSGVDHTAVLNGGLLWVRKRRSGAMSMEPIAASPLLERIRVYDSGPPAEPTGAVVSAVRDRLRAAPDGGQALLDRMEAATVVFRAQLTARREDPEQTVRSIRDYERCLEELGAVPEPIRDLVREVETRGGAAKISGAGSLGGPGAGGVLVYHPDAAAPAGWGFLGPLTAHAERLGAAGLRREAAA